MSGLRRSGSRRIWFRLLPPVSRWGGGLSLDWLGGTQIAPNRAVTEVLISLVYPCTALRSAIAVQILISSWTRGFGAYHMTFNGWAPSRVPCVFTSCLVSW